MTRKSGVKKDIFDIWNENPDWSGKEIQAAVIKTLGSKKSRGGTYPGLRLVQDYVKDFKDNLGQLTEEDQPWSIAASVRFGLTPEASKDLFDMWRFSLAVGRPITIRQAKWIVHIRGLYRDPEIGLPVDAYTKKVTRTLWLIRQGWLYSILERASRIMGEEYFNTTDIDAASFMPNWEHATALTLGTVSRINYSQEALAKIEKHGTSLISPTHSVTSVEQAVWHAVRAEPPSHLEIDALGLGEEALPEEDDLVCAYWLMHLSKGTLWNDLPEQPEVKKIWEERRRSREKGYFVPDPGGFPDDSMYSRQLAIRQKLHDWIKTDSLRRLLLKPVITGSAIEQYLKLSKADLPDGPTFNATLLKTVGHQVTPEQMDNWLNLHKAELLVLHKGFLQLAADVQTRFVNDEETYRDRKALKEADSQAEILNQNRQKAIEQEFMDMVKEHGEPVYTRAFWEPVIAEWHKRHPAKVNPMIPVSWEDFSNKYERLMRKYNQNDKHADSPKGGAK